MKPRMSETELRLFECFLRCSDRYLEFGSGGSTCVAANLVKSSVLAIDSSRPWLDKVAQYCADAQVRLTPNLVHVDLGPLGDWGYPSDPATRESWPAYHRAIWQDPSAANTDLYLIDGRFRIACFLQVLIHADQGAIIMFHDFQSRKYYHIARDLTREIAIADDLSIFLVSKETNRQRAQELLEKYMYDSA